METFTEPKPFVDHPQYGQDRADAIAELDLGAIDPPIVDIVAAFAGHPHCFPLQSCWGHFIRFPGQDRRTLVPVPAAFTGRVRYRIAYIALCIENSRRGRKLREILEALPSADPETLQFGSAGWFWRRCANSYVLQVDPAAHMQKDEAILDAALARHVQTVRDRFFDDLRRLVRRDLDDGRPAPRRGEPA